MSPGSPTRVGTAHPHVVLDADGHPFVRGSDVPVRRLWYWHRRGVLVATLIARYPSLAPAAILDALSYAYDEPAVMAAEEAFERRLLWGAP